MYIILREALADRTGGTIVNSFFINNLKYVDGTVLETTSKYDLQALKITK